MSENLRAKANRTNIILGILLLVAIMVMAGIWVLSSGGFAVVAGWLRGVDPVIYWIGVIALMLAMLGIIGHAAANVWLGALIDFTNTMSLSRLQVTLWTVIILSAYLVIAIPRIFGSMTPIEQLPSDDPFLKQCEQGRSAEFHPTVADCGGGPLQITFPPEVLLAMGISLAAFAGSHLIQGAKSNQQLDLGARMTQKDKAQDRVAIAQTAYDTAVEADNKSLSDQIIFQNEYDLADAAVKNASPSVTDDLKSKLNAAKLKLDAVQLRRQQTQGDKTLAQTALNAAQEALDNATKEEQAALTEAEGKLHRNENPAQANWSELFRGNEITNYQQVSMGKVQMFFFTWVVLLAYAAAIAELLHSGSSLLNPLGVAFPAFSQSLVALLALSQGTYLVNKATS
jgi:hypothetical protein